MGSEPLQHLATWQNFYVIVGSSAGALTGLQFVVMTLLTQAKAVSSMREVRAFGTPTVLHFCASLLISAFMVIPWCSPNYFSALLGALGLLGLIYSINTIWHARESSYRPDLADWISYTALPLASYTALVASAILAWFSSTWALPAVAADSIAFLLLGIHNSWDTLTYVALNQSKESKEP